MDRPPYPVVLRLYAIASERWPEIDAAYAEVDLITFPPHRFCNLVYGWCVKWLNEDKREKFDYDLTAPLPGTSTRHVSEATAEAEGAAFLAVMAMAGQQKEAAGGVRT